MKTVGQIGENGGISGMREFENAKIILFHSWNLSSILNCRKKSTESWEVM